MTEEHTPRVGTFNPNQINEIEPSRLRFPLRYSREGLPSPEGATVGEHERTPAGYLEIEWQYEDTQRALNLDFDIFAATTYSRAQLEELAKPHIQALNVRRAALKDPDDPDKSHPATPVEVNSDTNSTFLRHIIRPAWHERIPQDTEPESEAAWDKFKAQYPEHMQINLEELRELDGKMRVLSNDEGLRSEVQAMRAEQITVMRAASEFLGAERKADAIGRRIADIYRAAGTSGRQLTRGEHRHLERLQAQQVDLRRDRDRGNNITSERMLAKVKHEVHRRKDIQRRREFERGLVLTDQMQEIIDELLPSLAQGNPALLVGETGGAKTALAEFLSREYFGVEPELVSGFGEVNSYQLIGKPTLENKGGVAVSGFTPGPVIRAMQEGRPLIIDEINGMPPDFLKRLNKILQLRPGDVFKPQEDSGQEITISPGFYIIATANEKSKRYKGVEDLGAELQNRFGANVARINYPDHDVVFGQPPVENAIIARAALTDSAGNISPHVSMEQLEDFVRACHVTQQVFTANFGQGFIDYVTTTQAAEQQPGLEDAVLAPRTMVSFLVKVRDSYGKVSLDQVLRSFVTGIKSKNDRQQMTNILQSHGFLSADKSQGGTV